MKGLKLILMPVIALIASGCFFSREAALQVAEYVPELRPSAVKNDQLQVGSVVNFSGAGKEFVIRRKDGSIYVDEARRWLIMPEQMLKNAMSLRFTGSENGRVNAEIVKFEFSAESNELSAIVLFRTIDRDGKRSNCCRAASVKVVKENYGAAVSELWEKLFREIK